MKIIPVSFRDAGHAQYIFLALFKKESLASQELFSHISAPDKKLLLQFAKSEFNADDREVKTLWTPKGRIVLFGLGDKSKWNYRKENLLGRRFVQYAKQEKIKEFSASFPSSNTNEDAKRFATNALLADFEFNIYREAPQDGWPEIKTIMIATDAKFFAVAKQGIAEGIIIGEETNECRQLANMPGGDMTPDKLADAARVSAKSSGVTAKVLEEKEMKKLGMGGVLGVGRGSAVPPRFIILEYKKGPKDQKPLVLAGKGITFDTGGLNLKPEGGIYEMHMDMSGGAAVIHGIAAIARLKLPINVVGLIPAAENMPSGSSYHPGDVLRTMSGKTIEVLNTDAEGRVVLSDALYYGSKLNPGLMVDFATLTGAAMVALGAHCSALFTNRENLQNTLIEIGKTSGDYVWPFPLWDEYASDIKGTFGDVANVGKDRKGGAINGAKFLEQFIGNTSWAHIDIAPRMTTHESEYLSKGASGVGVRYIIELAKNYINGVL